MSIHVAKVAAMTERSYDIDVPGRDDMTPEEATAYEQSILRRVRQTLVGRSNARWSVLSVELRGGRPDTRLEIRIARLSGGTGLATTRIWDDDEWGASSEGWRETPDSIASILLAN